MDRISFLGQVVIVTGAGRGLGRAYAMDLGRRGAKVVVNDLGCSLQGEGSSREIADGVVDEIRAAGGTAVASYDTVCTPMGGEAILQTALERYGRVDAVIANAGILSGAAFEETGEDDWDALVRTHLKGHFNVMKPAFTAMKKQGYGRLLCVASATAVYGNVYQVAYGAAKAGVIGLMHSLANEGRPHGILVNAVLPMGKSRMAQAIDPRGMAEFGRVPAKFFAQAVEPEYTVPLVTYLVSDKNTATHAIYGSAGGRYARLFIGVTDGWQGPLDRPASAEDVLAHLGQIEDRARISEFQSISDEFIGIVERSWPKAPPSNAD